jgi:hypothetical protein
MDEEVLDITRELFRILQEEKWLTPGWMRRQASGVRSATYSVFSRLIASP